MPNGSLQPICPVCEASSVRADGTGVRLPYGEIATCGRCGSGALVPRPPPGKLIDLHQDADYFNHAYFESRRELSPRMARKFERRAARLRSFFPGDRKLASLDIGCDTGAFVEYLGQGDRAFRAIGIDISPAAVEAGRARGLDLRCGDLESLAFPAESLDIVTAYDLIEHLSDPLSFLREAHRILKPGGVLALETPNFGGLVFRIGRLLARLGPLRATLEPLQARLWPKFHVQYFTRDSMASALRGNGFADFRVEKLEIPISEVSVAQPLLRAALFLVLSAASLTGARTLLHVLARKS
jgi:SAM-dependent methyltransferase